MVTVDGLKPKAVEKPKTVEELAGCLSEASRAGQAVIPIGGGRALGMGDPPARFDLALVTTGLDRIVEVSPEDLTATVQAGVTLEALQAELGKARQFLPLDPFASPGHTIGGLLATAWSGPLRQRYGTPREFLVGLQVALPDGRLARSGGKVVKNVSGYDLNKLHFGALGSLGVITEASFKVFPRPLFEETVEASEPQLTDAWREARRALELKLPPVALELVREPDRHRLVARFAGSEDGVRRMVRELVWAPVGEADFWQQHSRRRAGRWLRVAVPPEALRDVLQSLPEAASWWAHPGVGVVHWVDFESAQVAAVRAAAEDAGGSAVLLAAPSALKRELGAWGRQPATIDLMRRVKRAFDPAGTLSPGRYLV